MVFRLPQRIGACFALFLIFVSSAHAIELRFKPKESWGSYHGPAGPFQTAGEAWSAYKGIHPDVPCVMVERNFRPAQGDRPNGLQFYYNGAPMYYIWDVITFDSNCQEKPPVDGGYISGGMVCPPDLGGATQQLSASQFISWCPKNIPDDDDCDDECKKGKKVGNPVEVYTGMKSQRDVDYAGLDGLNFQRRYSTRDGTFHSQLTTRIEGNDVPDDPTKDCWRSVVHPGNNKTWGYCGTIMDFSDLFRRLYVDSNGRWMSASGASANAAASTPNINDRIAQVAVSGGYNWHVKRADNTHEVFNTQGRLASKTYPSGRTHNFVHSDVGTPQSTAPGPGYPISQQDQFGRTLSWTYNADGSVATMTDPGGGVYTYTYADPATCTPQTCGKLISVTYPDGAVRTYHWNETGNLNDPGANKRLTGITDELGNRFSTYTYDAYGRTTSTEHAGGVNKFTLSWPNQWTQTSATVVDPLGTSRTYAATVYYDIPQPTTITQPNGAGAGTTFDFNQYDAQGRVYAFMDHAGRRECFAYDKPRNLVIAHYQGVTAGGYCHGDLHTTPMASSEYIRRVSKEWHADWRLPKRIAEPFKRTTIVYNGDGGVLCAPASVQVNGAPAPLVCSVTEQATTDTNGNLAFTATATGNPRTTQYTYNADGQVLTVDGSRTDVTDVTTYTYYANDPSQGAKRGMVATITDAAGNVTTFSNYDAHGKPLSMSDANGVVSTLVYDLRQRLTSKTVGGFTTSYTYDLAGQLKRVTTPDSSFVDFTYDAAHRLTKIVDSLGNKAVFELDNAGNRTRTLYFDSANDYPPAGQLNLLGTTGYQPSRTASAQFNNLNRLWKVIGGTTPASQITEHGFDNSGNVKTVKDALNRTTTNFYDNLNRLTKIEDPLNGTASPTSFAYNARDMLTQVTDPKGLNTTYTYNGYGDMLTQVSPDTGTTTFTYDDAGNALTKTDARNVVAVMTYDALNRISTISYPAVGTDPAEVVSYTYDSCTNGKGRLCQIADKTGTTTWTYDSLGRLASKSQTNSGLTQTYSYGYNSVGQLGQVTTPAGVVIAYTYQNNRIVSVSVNGTNVLTDVVYEPFGPNGGWKWGNSTQTTPNLHLRIFDQDYRTTEVATDQPQVGVTPVLKRTLTWDYVSRITAITDPNSATDSFAYGYDNLDRLTGVTPNGQSQLFGYTYDKVGNRLTSTTSGATTNYTYPATNHRLQSLSGAQTKSFAYDAAGNMTGDGVNTWRYGGNNRPYEVVTPTGTVSFAINALGQRIKKSGLSGTTRFFYDEEGRLVGEYTDMGGLVQETVWLNDFPVATVRPGAGGVEVYYVHPDHLGTPRAVTRPSDNKVVWKWDNTEPFGANGRNENPSGVGIFEYNLGFAGQYCDKETNTCQNWMRDYDPLTGRYRQSDPIGLAGGINTYAYVYNNPLATIDPTGTRVEFSAPNPQSLSRLHEAYAKIKGTKHGKMLCEVLEKDEKTYKIEVGPIAHYNDKKFIIVVPTEPGRFDEIWTEKGRERATVERILAHEIGHAATGLSDFGPNNNWQVNENPIMKELGQSPRTRYR